MYIDCKLTPSLVWYNESNVLPEISCQYGSLEMLIYLFTVYETLSALPANYK